MIYYFRKEVKSGDEIGKEIGGKRKTMTGKRLFVAVLVFCAVLVFAGCSEADIDIALPEPSVQGGGITETVSAALTAAPESTVPETSAQTPTAPPETTVPEATFPPETAAPEQTPPSATEAPELRHYILNTHSKKIHLPTCKSAVTIKESNRKEVDSTLEDLYAQGYTACGNCHPDRN